MPLTPTADVVSTAYRDGRAVGAFNVITLEHAEAVVTGAEAAGCPVICQISENAVPFHGSRLAPIARATAALAETATVPVALHLDHVTGEALLRRAADCGFGSVMFDASALPHAENVTATRAAARWAHAQGLWLEAELGEIGGKDGVHAPSARTDPDQARDFVSATGVDALAVAVGSSLRENRWPRRRCAGACVCVVAQRTARLTRCGSPRRHARRTPRLPRSTPA